MGLALWEDLHESEQKEIRTVLEKLPDKALQYFEAQYYMLAVKCPPFAKWLNYKESDKARTQLSTIEEKLEALAETRPQFSDIGLQHLSTTLENTYNKMALLQVDKALHELEYKYESTLHSPILDPKDMPVEEGKIALTYPKRSEIFIPQAFKLIHYTGQKQLELDYIWSEVPERNDLGDFLLNYFLNSASQCSPLIILGQPGSGKSLLTSMLAARMLVSSFTPIRIELRNINAEADIKTQITEQIVQMTGRRFDWGMLSDQFEQRPGLILFDGYDELLQASGKVFSAYLRDIEQFQIDQIALKRPPVRTIVTSRINLIDKAEIPPNATIIRLLEFDEAKQKYWIDIWNNANNSYFQQTKVQHFEIPPNNKEIKELAGQPLLLLMLALYDSTSNQLGKARRLNQTLLYDYLLRQFIERELRKDINTFKNMNEVQREEAIEHRMECFGVAAIGMFNRRVLHINVKQLDADLGFFRFEQTLSEGRGRSLSQAEKLFGSFFFVKLEAAHKFLGRKTSSETQEQDNESDVAYEFLHNTFGEFLTADFILRKVLNKTYSIYKMSGDRYEQPRLRQIMGNPNGDLPGADWYACLMCTPLFSRPVIIGMLQQWLKACLQHRKKERIDRRDEKEFLRNLDVIVESFLEFVLSKDQLPDIMIGKKEHSFDRLAALGYLAIYTLNLILLRTMFDPDGYTFIEVDEITERERFPSQDGTRAWDRLTYLWRSWFSLETLDELAAIFIAERDGKKVHLKMKSKSTSPFYGRRYDSLGSVWNVSQALADNTAAGLAGLLLHDSFSDNESELDDIRKIFDDEGIYLLGELFIKKLRHLNEGKIISSQEAISLLQEMLKQLLYSPMFPDQDALASLLPEMARVIRKLTDFQGIKIESDDFFRFYIHEERTVTEEFKIARELNQREFLDMAIRNFIRHRNTGKRHRDSGLLQSKMAIESTGAIELLVEITKFVRERGNWSDSNYLQLENFQKRFLQSFKGRIPTTLAVEMIKLAFEAGNHEILNFFSQHYYSYLEEMVDPEKLISDDLAVELVKLACEKGDRSSLDYFMRYLDRRLKERCEVPSAVATGVIKLARQVGDHKTLTIFLEKYTHEIIAVRNIPSSLFIELLNLADENRKQTILEELRIYSCKIIAGSRYIPHDLAVAMIKLARKVDDQDILDYFSGNYLKSLLQAQKLVPIELAVELVKLILVSDVYDQTSIESFYQKNISVDRCQLDLLTVGTLVDLQQLAETFHDNDMLSKIKQKTVM